MAARKYATQQGLDQAMEILKGMISQGLSRVDAQISQQTSLLLRQGIPVPEGHLQNVEAKELSELIQNSEESIKEIIGKCMALDDKDLASLALHHIMAMAGRISMTCDVAISDMFQEG